MPSERGGDSAASIVARDAAGGVYCPSWHNDAANSFEAVLDAAVDTLRRTILSEHLRVLALSESIAFDPGVVKPLQVEKPIIASTKSDETSRPQTASTRPCTDKTARGCQKSKGSSHARYRHHVAVEAQPYFEKHCIIDVVQSMLQSVIKEKPPDPFSYMISVLENSSKGVTAKVDELSSCEGQVINATPQMSRTQDSPGGREGSDSTRSPSCAPAIEDSLPSPDHTLPITPSRLDGLDGSAGTTDESVVAVEEPSELSGVPLTGAAMLYPFAGFSPESDVADTGTIVSRANREVMAGATSLLERDLLAAHVASIPLLSGPPSIVPSTVVECPLPPEAENIGNIFVCMDGLQSSPQHGFEATADAGPLAHLISCSEKLST